MQDLVEWLLPLTVFCFHRPNHNKNWVIDA